MNPPELHIIPSRLAWRGLLVLHLAAVVVALMLPLLWCAVALFLVSAHFVWLRRSPTASSFLQVLPDGRVSLAGIGSNPQQAEILPSSLITAWLIILHLRTDTGRLYLLLWPDSAEEDSLRRWRVWLRWSLPTLQRRLAESDSQD
ncbi:MAG: hypothetical protein P4L87_06640 [Formivibrio sp.]|nr:hypothetical protein [Formivibrio sp.]